MDVLTERRERLLRFIVDEYVRSAHPVASNSVVQRTGLPVSSATIRNEMVRIVLVAGFIVISLVLTAVFLR